MILLSSLMLLVAGVTVVACVTAVACIETVAGILLAFFKFLMASCCWSLCCCCRSWCSQGVVGVSAVPFEHAVAGGPAVTGFPAAEGILSVASVPAYPCVHILAGGFTYWIVK